MDSKCFLPLFVVVISVLTSSSVLGAFRSTAMEEQKDASDVTWAHAVNSRDALEKTLGSAVDFMEADVLLGHIKGSENDPPIPVMAHPPSKISDISLADWLNTVATRGSEKGLKLDFKSIEVVEPSLITLEKFASRLNGFLWLSADVLSGPVRSPKTSVQVDQFLSLCNKYFPNAVLSLGWTTYWIRRFPINTWQYEWRHVRQMADVVRCKLGNSYPPITFSVRGIFASRSIRQLQWLLDTIPRSTLTVWSETGDNVNAEDFTRIQEAFPKEKVYFDVPDNLKPLHKSKNNIASSKKKNIVNDRWLSVIREQENNCESFTYLDNSDIVFGKSSNILVLQRSLLLVDAKNNFTFTGRIKFFAGDHIVNPVHWEHKLKFVLVDVRNFPKNSVLYSKKKLAYTIKDTEALWPTVNTSVLYTFEHAYFQDYSACRMFKLTVNASLTFEAWTIPCDETYDDISLEDVSKSSISEISLGEKLDSKDGIFMVGFHSYGEEYVLLHDLTISGQDKVTKPKFDIPKQLALRSSEAAMTQNIILFLLPFLICILAHLCSSRNFA